MPDIRVLQERIGFVFKNPDLLLQALTHKSYSNENPHHTLGNNERLEFLGDTVLSLIISQTLFLRNPDIPEGDLSKMRANVVSGTALAGVARSLGLGTFLLLGAGEEKGAGREKTSLLSDALEAMIAAIYLDQGILAAQAFVLKVCADLLNPISLGRLVDYKTQLQEFCQERSLALPGYHIVKATGADHQRQFEVEVTIAGVSYGTGTGSSKKDAHQASAKMALERLIGSQTAVSHEEGCSPRTA